MWKVLTWTGPNNTVTSRFRVLTDGGRDHSKSSHCHGSRLVTSLVGWRGGQELENQIMAVTFSDRTKHRHYLRPPPLRAEQEQNWVSCVFQVVQVASQWGLEESDSLRQGPTGPGRVSYNIINFLRLWYHSPSISGRQASFLRPLVWEQRRHISCVGDGPARPWSEFGRDRDPRPASKSKDLCHDWTRALSPLPLGQGGCPSIPNVIAYDINEVYFMMILYGKKKYVMLSVNSFYKYFFEILLIQIFCSSVGQSERLLTVRSEVRALPGETF